MSTCLTEFNEEVYRKGLLEEGREAGYKEGCAEERLLIIKKLFSHNMSCEKIAEMLEMPEEEIRQIIETIRE